MSYGRRWRELSFLLAAVIGCGAALAQSPAAADDASGAGAAAGTAAASAQQNTPTQAGAGTTPATSSQGTAQAAAQAAAAKKPSDGRIVHHLAADISVALGPNWQEFDAGAVPPPTAIATFAPPFHLTGILALQNANQPAMLQFATSSNPLIGHDSSWLDAQMHMPSGSGMSVLDLIFYYFFPPSAACIEQVLTQDPKATFAPVPVNGSDTGTNNSTDPVLQVSLVCKAPPTIAGFFSSQVSSGITFAQTADGPRAYAKVANFYLAPMDRETIGGMTWFIFEAQRTDPLGPNAGTNFNLPGNLQGAQSDYFWAIGAISPFPFVSDAPRANQPLIHVAYAGVGAQGNKKAEFMGLLQRVQVKGASAGE
jgi:hypothetical protein